METIKDITIELSTKNIIVTYLDDRGNSTKKGYSPSILEDWEEIESKEDTLKMVNCFWEGIERPVIEDDFEE